MGSHLAWSNKSDEAPASQTPPPRARARAQLAPGYQKPLPGPRASRAGPRRGLQPACTLRDEVHDRRRGDEDGDPEGELHELPREDDEQDDDDRRDDGLPPGKDGHVRSPSSWRPRRRW